ncbi:MAG: PQQ-like beta-propeller repeat protein [Anaerolineae bacterium]|nr:PQQ-like beta-propeller repeat protein [Anaerolineae bacterium]
MKLTRILRVWIALAAVFSLIVPSHAYAQTGGGNNHVYLPAVLTPGKPNTTDWAQLGRDAQRTNYTPLTVSPPYCYAWKWNAVPVASRAQPVVKSGILFVGGMDGRLYARDATTGAPIWDFPTDGPIRHSPAATGAMVITGSFDGNTYALYVNSGSPAWITYTGSSATAPLIDEAAGKVYVASTNGLLTALSLSSGSILWQYDAGEAILTSPALSVDGGTVYLGSEAIQAIAVNASNGTLRWKTGLRGQSLGERYPVVVGNTVFYRSQPLDSFHVLLRPYGDDVMDRAGSIDPNWANDWAKVKPQITSHLSANPDQQTFFALDAANGASRGTAPVLYTYGSNDIPNVPVYDGTNLFLTYRARHGIQTDSGRVHVATKYDAELGRMNLSTLDITGLTAGSLDVPIFGGPAWRMTSDEASFLTKGGDILWMDSWERLGGLNVVTGVNGHAGNVSNLWPECYSADNKCGPEGPRPFYPLSGSGAGYPFPGPRATEGHARAGVVIANDMVYWKVADAGLAAFKHSSTTCGAATVWQDSGGSLVPASLQASVPPALDAAPALSSYLNNDRSAAVAITPQNQDLVDRLRGEVRALLTRANGNHLLPFYLNRGFSEQDVWPYNSGSTSTDINGLTNPAKVLYAFHETHGNVVWHDPGELLMSLAMAYPYLDNTLKTDVRAYVSAEWGRYSPIGDLPYANPSPWLVNGVARENYNVPFRNSLNNWPSTKANLNSIYALWLWSRNTGDYTWARNNWNSVASLYNNRKNNIRYYADLGGIIGYYRLARDLNNSTPDGKYTTAMNDATSVLNSAMTNGLNFTTFKDRARDDDREPRGMSKGWSAPVFYGIGPEVGLYLREQFNGAATNHLLDLERVDNVKQVGMAWWYLTRAGEHAEEGETSYLHPLSGWSHFMAHAYIVGNSQAELRRWLDRPWTEGDLYSIQKIVAVIQAP